MKCLFPRNRLCKYFSSKSELLPKNRVVCAHAYKMGAALARHAPPPVQALISTLMRAQLELVVAGLDSSGKTTLVRALRQETAASESPLPTTGLVFHRTRRAGIALRIWDLGGGQRFRRSWSQQAKTCDALIFVVDATDGARIAEARQALHDLLIETGRRTLPTLILANKVDLISADHRGPDELGVCEPVIRGLGLDARSPCAWCVLSVSAQRGTNLEKAPRWLVLQAHASRTSPAQEDDAIEVGAAASFLQRVQLRSAALQRKLAWLRGSHHAFTSLRRALLDDADEEPL